jgi:hypothetical protein
MGSSLVILKKHRRHRRHTPQALTVLVVPAGLKYIRQRQAGSVAVLMAI